MRLGGIAADEEDRPGVVDVVVAVGHGAVAPCVRYACNRRGVADSRLVVDVVRAPVGGELPEQVGLFVVVLCRTQPVDAVRAAFVPDLHHAIADLVDGLIPGDANPFAVLLLHRVLQPPLAVGVFADRRALGAMGPEIERAVPSRLLAGPDAVLHLGNDRAADRAVRANGLAQLDRACAGRGFGLRDRASRGGDCRQSADRQA